MTWPVSRLDRLAETCLGKMLDKQKNRGEMKPYLRNINVRWGSFDLSDLQQMPFEDHEANRYSVAYGDLVVCEGGEPGRCAVWTGTEPIFIQKALHRVRCGERLKPIFLAYWLRHLAESGGLAKHLTGTTIRHLPGVALAALEVPHPPVAEQLKVVSEIETQLTRVDATVASLVRAKTNLKRARASILQAAVEGRLVPTEAALARAEGREYEPASTLLARILGERRLASAVGRRRGTKDESADWCDGMPWSPEGWIWARWSQVGFSQNGRAFPSSEYCTDGVPLLRPGNLHGSGRVEWNERNTARMPRQWADDHPAFIVRGSELVINLTAQSLKDEFLGRVCVTSDGEFCLLNQRIARLTPIGILPAFLLVVFRSRVFRRFVQSLNTGSLIQHMFTTQLDAFAIPLPPLKEQHRIVTEVDRRLSVLDALDATIDANLARCTRLRQAILQLAFSGRLVPSDPATLAAEPPRTTIAQSAPPHRRAARAV